MQSLERSEPVSCRAVGFQEPIAGDFGVTRELNLHGDEVNFLAGQINFFL